MKHQHTNIFSMYNIKEWQSTITKITDYIRQAFTFTILNRQRKALIGRMFLIAASFFLLLFGFKDKII